MRSRSEPTLHAHPPRGLLRFQPLAGERQPCRMPRSMRHGASDPIVDLLCRDSIEHNRTQPRALRRERISGTDFELSTAQGKSTDARKGRLGGPLGRDGSLLVGLHSAPDLAATNDTDRAMMTARARRLTRRLEVEVVSTHMTKAHLPAAGAEQNDVADLDHAVADGHPIDRQFHQLPLLCEVSVGQADPHPLAEVGG